MTLHELFEAIGIGVMVLLGIALLSAALTGLAWVWGWWTK